MDVVINGSARVAIDGVCVANCGAQVGDIAFWILITIIAVCFGTAFILILWGWSTNWGQPTKITSQLTDHITVDVHQYAAFELGYVPRIPPKVSAEFIGMLSDTPIQTPE